MLKLTMPRRLLVALLLITSLSMLPWLSAQSTPSPWEMENSGTTAGLRGVHAVGGGVVWASGTNGTVLRTEDSGYMWQSCAMPPGAEKLDFRAIWAWDANTAIVMSSGTGDLSKIYKTTDGCSHWTLLYTNPDKDGFWDAMVFLTQGRGFILGDPVDGRFVLLDTVDGGKNWDRSAGVGLESDIEASGAFAASNSSLLIATPEPGFYIPIKFGTTGAYIYTQSIAVSSTPARAIPVASSAKNPPRRGAPFQIWHRIAVPLARQDLSSGIFSLAYRRKADPEYGYTMLAVGGDYTKPGARAGTAAWSPDGTQWTASTIQPGGFRSAVAWDPDLKLWITVGPNGSDLSRNDGRTWQPIEHGPPGIGKGGEWNALSLPWVVGPNGRIAKLNYESLQPAGKRLKPPSGARPRHPQ